MAVKRNGFQNFVTGPLPPAIAGDYAGAEIRAYAPAGPLAFVADPAGVRVGVFAWANPATGLVTNTQQANSLLGFVHREQGQTLITVFLDYAREIIQGGFAVDLLTRGNVWARFNAAAAVGALVYADPATGEATTTSGGNVATPFRVVTAVPADSAFTGVIDINGILTVSAPSGGLILPGNVITGTGVPDDTFIVSQITGTTGLAGTYNTTYRKVVTSTAMTARGGRLAKISTWQVA